MVSAPMSLSTRSRAFDSALPNPRIRSNFAASRLARHCGW